LLNSFLKRLVLGPKAQDRLHHEHSGLTLLRARVSTPGRETKKNPESSPDTRYKPSPDYGDFHKILLEILTEQHLIQAVPDVRLTGFLS
jgi:hypothetical protein